MIQAQPGSVSWGTMKTKDLIARFMAVLEAHDHPNIEDYQRDLKGITGPEDMEFFLHESLWDAMDQLSPGGCSFGVHPDDGADYGFWPIDDEE